MCFVVQTTIAPQKQEMRPALISLAKRTFPSGGDKGSRTPDLLNAIETLYQLSYIPTKGNGQ